MRAQKRPWQGQLWGALTVVVFLSALIFLPPLLRQTKHSVVLPPVEPKQFSGDTTFTWIAKAPGLPTASPVTLREVLAAHPRGILLNFWATWCPPCLEELPSLEALDRQSRTVANLPRVVTISVDDKAASVTELFRTSVKGFGLPVLHDLGGKFAESIGVTKFPETFWVRSDGTVAQKWVGPQNWLSAEVLERLRLQ